MSSKFLCVAVSAVLVAASPLAGACPDAKSKDKTASGEQNMSKPSAKFSKAQKPGKAIAADNAGALEKLEKPKA